MKVILTIQLALLLSMAGCTQLPRTGDAIAHGSAASAGAAPATELTADSLFDFLMGETALQRNMPDVAVESFIRLARETRNPRIAEHATDIALRTRHFGEAKEAIDLWVALEPDSMHARQAAVALFVANGQLDNVRPHVEQLLKLEPETVDLIIRTEKPC